MPSFDFSVTDGDPADRQRRLRHLRLTATVLGHLSPPSPCRYYLYFDEFNGRPPEGTRDVLEDGLAQTFAWDDEPPTPSSSISSSAEVSTTLHRVARAKRTAPRPRRFLDRSTRIARAGATSEPRSRCDRRQRVSEQVV
jgi:hypothetical protein